MVYPSKYLMYSSCFVFGHVQERKQKEQMLNKLDQLHNDNMRLQEESQMTAEQLRHFTDWFFNAIEKWSTHYN